MGWRGRQPRTETTNYNEMSYAFNDGTQIYYPTSVTPVTAALTVGSDGKLTITIPTVEMDANTGTGIETLMVATSVHEI